VGSLRGELAPRVPTQWPQDREISLGPKSKLYYDDLNIYEWSQGVMSIIEADEDINSNINSYMGIQSLYKGFQNFILKLVPVAYQINIKLFGELLQGFYNIQILDLI
jgi:hypothetical protein